MIGVLIWRRKRINDFKGALKMRIRKYIIRRFIGKYEFLSTYPVK